MTSTAKIPLILLVSAAAGASAVAAPDPAAVTAAPELNAAVQDQPVDGYGQLEAENESGEPVQGCDHGIDDTGLPLHAALTELWIQETMPAIFKERMG